MQFRPRALLCALSALPLAAQSAPAPAQQPQGQGGPSPIFALLIMAALFYFIVWMPSSKARKKQQQLVDNLKVGDRVLLNSGIFGTVHKIVDGILHLRIADNVRIEVLKSAVSRVEAPESEKQDG